MRYVVCCCFMACVLFKSTVVSYKKNFRSVQPSNPKIQTVVASVWKQSLILCCLLDREPDKYFDSRAEAVGREWAKMYVTIKRQKYCLWHLCWANDLRGKVSLNQACHFRFPVLSVNPEVLLSVGREEVSVSEQWHFSTCMSCLIWGF